MKCVSKHLFKTYNITSGNMLSIKNYMLKHNPAIIKKRDKHHEKLNKYVKNKLKNKNFLY